MGIVPISGIASLPLRTERTDGELSGVFRVEFQREQEQDSYSPEREGADRGLEAEQDEPVEQAEGAGSSEFQGSADSSDGGAQINFFA